MSIESVLNDNELLIIQSKELEGKKVYVVDTTASKAYDNAYMLIVMPNSGNMIDTRYGYFEDVEDAFYFYDIVS
jgi:hypothetical protein